MTGILTGLNEVLSAHESQTKESILCPTMLFCAFLYPSATPEFFRRKEENREEKCAVGHRVMLENLVGGSTLSFPTDSSET